MENIVGIRITLIGLPVKWGAASVNVFGLHLAELTLEFGEETFLRFSNDLF